MTRHNLARFNEIVNTIYTSSTESPRWRSFLRHLKETTGSLYVCIGFGDQELWKERVQYLESNNRYTLKQGEDYSDFLRFSPFTRLPEGRITTISELSRSGQPVHPEFASRVMHRFGITDIIGVNVVRQGTRVANLRLGRASNVGCYSREEKNLCALMLPHLQRVCAEVFGADSARSPWQAVLFDTLRSVGIGVVMVDASRRILDASAAALEIMQLARHLLCPGFSRLRLLDRTQDAALAAGVGGVMRGRESYALRVTGAEAQDGLHVVCVREPGTGMYGPARHVIVFMSRAAQGRRLSIRTATLCSLFGLTRAEARVVCGLVSGLSIAQIAVRHSISRNTAYSHVKSAFVKIGVNQQSALVSRVLCSLAVLGRD